MSSMSEDELVFSGISRASSQRSDDGALDTTGAAPSSFRYQIVRPDDIQSLQVRSFSYLRLSTASAAT